MRTPRELDLALTNACNLRCRYCYHFDSAGDVPADLPLDEWVRFFDELQRCAVMEVGIGGGEPLSRPDVADLLQALSKRSLRFSMYSNGTLVTDDVAALLKATGRCKGVQVSLDGAAPEVHDACRGKGSFERAVAGIRRLQAHEVPVSVRVTLHRRNVRTLEDTAHYLLEEVGLPLFSINAAYDMGLCSRNRDFVQLTLDDRMFAMEVLLRLTERYPGRIRASAGPLAQARLWASMERARAEGVERPGGGVLHACGGVYTRMAVRADGVMIPCNQLPHVELGRINRDDLATVWRTHPEMLRLRERRAIPLRTFPRCRDCDYVDSCTGGCPGMAWLGARSDAVPDPSDCLRSFLEQGGRLPHVVVG